MTGTWYSGFDKAALQLGVRRSRMIGRTEGSRGNIDREVMEDKQEALEVFGRRIQRCYGCFIAYHLKDMYLGEDVTFFCEHCKDENMFHFNEFARLLDLSKLKEIAEEHHH